MIRKTPAKNLKRIKFLLLDVDGVMTDGGIYYSNTGDELKRFDTKDGYGIVKFDLADANIAYIGDDEFDLTVLKRVGFSAAPSDAVPIVKKHVQYICTHSGGNGAVREVIDLILKSKK